MTKTEIKVTSEKQMRIVERTLKALDYKKTSDCMWATIYTWNNNEVILVREY